MKTFTATFTDRQAAVIEELAKRFQTSPERAVAVLVCTNCEATEWSDDGWTDFHLGKLCRFIDEGGPLLQAEGELAEERESPEAEADPETKTEADEQPEAVIERIPIPAPSRTGPDIVPFTLPEVAWMTGDDRFPEDQIRQASLNLEFHWRQTVLDADSRFEAQAIALSLLSFVEAHRQWFREIRMSTPHIAELKTLIPYHRWKLDYLNGDCECPKENRPEIIPIERLYAEAAQA